VNVVVLLLHVVQRVVWPHFWARVVVLSLPQRQVHVVVLLLRPVHVVVLLLHVVLSVVFSSLERVALAIHSWLLVVQRAVPFS
jgi:hypothetical protein